MENHKPEILAPCGTPAAFHAALNAGADAMYMALKQFGARAYAANFELNELLQAIEEAHLHERKIYLTLNTLLTDKELDSIPELMDPLYNAGLDAVLIQDFGLYRLLRERYPLLPLHASTQMNICSVEGAKYAKELGFSRVVPARELSLTELSEIREKADIEVEAFVHGAMCYCYSGRCYLSSFLGGRSGNRGRCAQPCRRMISGSYLFSMKDLCTLTDIPDLVKAGIDSLKIEGRMKNEYYVAAVVDAYKTIRDDAYSGSYSVEKAEKLTERLKDVFHRGGFTHGYLHQYSGKNMIDPTMPGRAGVVIGSIAAVKQGMIDIQLERDLYREDALELRINTEEEPVKLTSSESAGAGEKVTLRASATRRLSSGMKVYRVRNARLKQYIEDSILSQPPKIPVRAHFTLSAGEPSVLKLTALKNGGVISVSCTGMRAEAAANRPVTDAVITEKIGTFSDTDFSLSELSIDNDRKSFLASGEIKRLRREGIGKLRALLIEASRPYSHSSAVDDAAPPELPQFNEEPLGFTDPELMNAGPVCEVTSIRQARFLMLLSKKPSVIIFRNDLRYMDPDELVLFGRERGKVRFLVGFPSVYRSIIDDQLTERLLQAALTLDGAYIPGIDSFSLLRRKLRENPDKKLSVIVLGDGLYRYNRSASAHFLSEINDCSGKVWTEAPCELKEDEEPGSTFRIIYGRLPMMRTMQDPEEKTLTIDGKEYLLLYKNPEMCYNTILSSKAVISEVKQSAAAYLFTEENEKDMERLLREKNLSSEHGIRHRGLL